MKKKITIGILAHVDAGKTTLTKLLLREEKISSGKLFAYSNIATKFSLLKSHFPSFASIKSLEKDVVSIRVKLADFEAKRISREEIENTLRKRYELSDSKLSLAYETAVNQQPILDSIDTSAASLYVSIPFCPTRCSYCSFTIVRWYCC